MAALSALITKFLTEERPIGVLLDSDTVLSQAVAATRFYAGYADITAYFLLGTDPDISADTELSDSEWAIIRPLFLLYLEREEAKQLEASRGLGVDVYGRSSSEIQSEITLAEQELPKKAFCMEVSTV